MTKHRPMMRAVAIHTFPVWADTTPTQAWEIINTQGGRDEHPPVTGWANALIIEINGEQRTLLAIYNNRDTQ